MCVIATLEIFVEICANQFSYFSLEVNIEAKIIWEKFNNKNIYCLRTLLGKSFIEKKKFNWR